MISASLCIIDERHYNLQVGTDKETEVDDTSPILKFPPFAHVVLGVAQQVNISSIELYGALNN